MGNLRWQRVAELVANELRGRILSGELGDGDLLPKEEELREEYPVSKTSLREAMRILEAEGLVTIRRGNMGGAVVHRPSAANVAYTLAMVLAAHSVGRDAVATALFAVEPLCAALCAERDDRAVAVVPELRAIHERAVADIDDLPSAGDLARQFHAALVRLCGNEPLAVLGGALEAVWLSHEETWVSGKRDPLLIPVEDRRAALDIHERLIALIEAGDAEGARACCAEHLSVMHQRPAPDEEVGLIDPVRLRAKVAALL